MPNNFTKDFAKLLKNPTIGDIIRFYNMGLITMRECLISLSQQVISMEIEYAKEKGETK